MALKISKAQASGLFAYFRHIKFSFDPFAAVTLFKNHPSRLDATANGATLAHRASRNRSVLRNCPRVRLRRRARLLDGGACQRRPGEGDRPRHFPLSLLARMPRGDQIVPRPAPPHPADDLTPLTLAAPVPVSRR